jgi:hypothetical protein
MKTIAAPLAALLGFAALSRAEVPEPDNVVYGVITLGAVPVTAADTNVIVEARKSLSGPVVARYRMGDSLACADAYSLEIPLEAFFPLVDTNASRVGALVYLSVRDPSGVRDTRTLAIAQRGQLVRLDFAEPDTDGDRIPDRWELQYFGSLSGADPAADPDGDGRNNLQEFIDGTNPLVADGRHPADRSPADNLLTLEESDAYASAWLLGASWPGHSNGIPIAYVSRAATLALAGTPYVFTNSPPTNAPLWWVNLPHAGPRARGAQVASGLALPASVLPGTLFSVTLRVTPTNTVQTYAVQDQPPVGWTNVMNISYGGSYDSVHRFVKWGPFYDNAPRDLSYDLAAPASAAGAQSFQGIASFDGDDFPVSGTRSTTVSAEPGPVWTSARLEGGGPAFTLVGQVNTAYQIEASTNLIDWQLLQTTTTSAAGVSVFQPVNPTQSPHRFFRARRLP